MKTPTLAEVLAGAERAAERIKHWPRWKREIGMTNFEKTIAVCEAAQPFSPNDSGDMYKVKHAAWDEFSRTFTPEVVREMLELLNTATMHMMSNKGTLQWANKKHVLMRKIGGGK